jgi:outer membrane protein OmpA-like peptidoglycan-associated protein
LNIGAPLNNESNNGVLSVSPDGNSLLLFGGYDKKNPTHGLSITHKDVSGWAFPRKLIIENYYNYSNWVQYYLCNDNKTLILAIERDDSKGMNDIYVSFLKEDNSWTAPMNLGNDINTEGNEISPFLASDMTTLYYSTNGLNGFGDYDVYLSRRLDNSWQRWSKPENLGEGINTSGFDAYYKISAIGDYAYFVSNDNSIGLSDIFRKQIPQPVKPKPVALIYGKVINAVTKLPVESVIKYEILPDGIESGIASSDSINGHYKITLPSGRFYGFRAEARGYYSINDNIDLDSLDEYIEINHDLELIPIDTGIQIRLNNIFFDYGKSILRPESYPELNRVVKFLNEYPDIEIEISGHTDNRGGYNFNYVLSEKRAKSVVEYLIAQGINGKRLKYIGYGEQMPIADNSTDEGRQLNRRVEFKIIKK